MSKNVFRVEYESFIEARNLRVICLDRAAPTIDSKNVKICGRAYPFFFMFDNPCGIGLNNVPELPSSLIGEAVEFV